MSIYYNMVNKTKKEYFDMGKLGYGLKEQSYIFYGTTLLGYLMMDRWGENNDKQYPNDWNEDNKEFYFYGHWSGDKGVMLVDEYSDEYNQAEEGYDKNGSKVVEGGNGWVDISIPLRDEWNNKVKDWFEGKEEIIKELSY
jgi:hypothetical protein